jgi:hypothetical protein
LQFAKLKCKESAADWVRSHNVSRNLNFLHCKSIYMHHERRYTNVLSSWIQGSKKIATILLAALILTCSILTFNIYKHYMNRFKTHELQYKDFGDFFHTAL